MSDLRDSWGPSPEGRIIDALDGQLHASGFSQKELSNLLKRIAAIEGLGVDQRIRHDYC